MRTGPILAVIFLAAGLAGCFTSDKDLIGDADSATPFTKITFAEQNAKERTTATRTGKVYVAKQKDGSLTLRFKAVGTDLFLTEMSGRDKNGKVERLYALLKLDRATNTATTYKAIASKEDIGPGLRDCKDGTVCIDDLNAYLALAKAALAAGGKPDATYKVTLE
jgi:hypothetical protein